MALHINLKQGLRRIVLSFIGLGVILSLCFYICGGFIFDNNFIGKVNITDTQYNITENLQDFANEFLKNENDSSFWYTDFKCYPYRQYCKLKDNKFPANREIEVSIVNLKHYSNESLLKYSTTGYQPKLKVNVSMPSPFYYLMLQIWDFLKIFLVAGILYGIYLLFEFLVCWIIKGFKE